MFEIGDQLENISCSQADATSLLKVLHEFCYEEGVELVDNPNAMGVFGKRMVNRVALLGCAIEILMRNQKAMEEITNQIYELARSKKEGAR